MSEYETCKNCVHGVEVKDEKNIGHSAIQCRALPPYPALIPTSAGVVMQHLRPLCSPDDTCGMFEDITVDDPARIKPH